MSEASRAVPDGGTRRRIEGLVAGPAEACQRSQAGSNRGGSSGAGGLPVGRIAREEIGVPGR